MCEDLVLVKAELFRGFLRERCRRILQFYLSAPLKIPCATLVHKSCELIEEGTASFNGVVAEVAAVVTMP